MKNILQLLLLLCSINGIGQTFFENKQFGVSMQNPTDWNMADNKDFLKSIENIDFSKDDVSALIKASKGSLLLVAFNKYEIGKHLGLIPTIKISARLNPTQNFAEFKMWDAQSTEGIKKHVPDFENIIESKEIEISGLKGIENYHKFSMKTKEGTILKIKSRSYIIPVGKYYLTFAFIDGQETDDCSAEFEELIKTIKIKNP